MNTNTTETHSARLGKIARLPFHLRQWLNERLEDNEPSQRLVEQLNALPEVQAVLEDLFDGRPLSEQNLSAWKLGGFRDWQRHQETRVVAREFLDEAEELDEEVYFAKNCDSEDGSSMLDRVANRMALSLLQLFREAELGEKGPRRTRTMLETARELARLRRGDHQRQRAELAEQRQEEELDRASREKYEAQRAKTERQIAVLSAYAQVIRDKYIRGLAAGTLSPQREKWTRDYFANHAEVFQNDGIPGLPEGEELAALVEEVRASLPKRRQTKGAKAEPETRAAEEPENEGGPRPVKASQGGSRPVQAGDFSSEAIESEREW